VGQNAGVSNLDRSPDVVTCGGRADTPAEPVLELLHGREVTLGASTKVRRLLPTLGRRLVGAWCFIDHYGPDDITGQPGMQVPPHPHVGLQTVSWLLDGSVHHRDSLGSDVTIQPGQLGLMTAGRAIAHSEQSPAAHPSQLHGAQLWVALPDSDRHMAPAFEHHTALPVLTDRGLRATVLLGELAGAEVADVAVGVGELLYLGTGRTELRVRAERATRLLLLGGEPFDEQLVMWWNFVARSGAEITEARADWMAGRRFGAVTGGEPQPAPAMPATPLIPRGRAR